MSRLIDADAFKEYMRKSLEETRGCYPDKGEWAEAVTEQFCKDIDDQPTIEPQRWIQCSERLPEHSERYLVTAFDGTDRRTTVVPYQPRNGTWALTGRMAYWKVLAWMPLQEPYKEAET